MALNLQTETFRGFQKVGEVSAQTAVECRFGGEVEHVLTAHATVTLMNTEVSNGEVRYFGKALFSVVYEDAEKHVCRAEKGVEFSAKAQSDTITPATTCRVHLNCDNLSMRREGASTYLTALVGAEVSLYGEQSFEYLTGGDFVCKKEQITLPCAHLCGGVAEAEDEFETEFIGDILFHAETVNVTSVACETGVLKVNGEINLGLLALKGENALASFERLVPFAAEIPCEQASYGYGAHAAVSVGNVSVRAEADEERGKCALSVTLSLSVDGCVYEDTVIDGVVDAYSCENAIKLTAQTHEMRGAGEMNCTVERVSGKAMLSSPIDFSDTLQAITLQRAEADCMQTPDGKRVEGVVVATLLTLSADGSHRGIEMSLPFSLPVQAEGDCKVNVLVCGTSARQRQEGEIDGEATLKITLQEEKGYAATLLSAAEEGAPLEKSDCAISVYIPRVGDGLWELSKRLNKAPEEVLESNPNLQFPIREGERVIVYRKKHAKA